MSCWLHTIVDFFSISGILFIYTSQFFKYMINIFNTYVIDAYLFAYTLYIFSAHQYIFYFHFELFLDTSSVP